MRVIPQGINCEPLEAPTGVRVGKGAAPSHKEYEYQGSMGLCAMLEQSSNPGCRRARPRAPLWRRRRCSGSWRASWASGAPSARRSPPRPMPQPTRARLLAAPPPQVLAHLVYVQLARRRTCHLWRSQVDMLINCC